MMFEAPMANGYVINMHNIMASCIIALVALSSFCYAQNHNRQIFNNRIQLKSLAASLLPNQNINPEQTLNDHAARLRCWSRPTGCTAGELAQIGWSGCAKFRINPKTNRATCEPITQSPESTTTTINPTPQLAQQEESAPEEVTLAPDFEATIDSLVRSIEFERQQYEQRVKQNQEQNYYAQQQAKYGDDSEGAASMRPPVFADNTIDEVERGDTSRLDDNISANKRCKESNYDDGDDRVGFYDDCKRAADGGSDTSGEPTRNEPPYSRAPSAGDTHDRAPSRPYHYQQNRLARPAWQSGMEQDFVGRYHQAAAGSSPHHQQFGMTTDEAAKRLAETSMEQPEFAYLREAESTSKVPIMLLKFGAIRNQRRSSASASLEASNRFGGANTLLGPVRLGLSYPIVRLQRSDLNNLTQMDQIKFVKGIDLDGGASTSLVNRTLAPGSGQLQEPEVAAVATTTAGEDKNRPAQQQQQQQTTTPQPLECTMRRYTFKAVKSDSYGNTCSGLVSANICYGSCETGEIADWLFPHKKAIHKVCTHGTRIRRRILLTDCSSPNAENQFREYHYVDAKSCVCQKCHSQDTNCLGSLTRPYLGDHDESPPSSSSSSLTGVGGVSSSSSSTLTD